MPLPAFPDRRAVDDFLHERRRIIDRPHCDRIPLDGFAFGPQGGFGEQKHLGEFRAVFERTDGLRFAQTGIEPVFVMSTDCPNR